MKGISFKDRVKVYVKSGRGGDGSASFRREKFVPRGGPDGGDGGRGGHVFLRADKDVDSLVSVSFEPHLRAENGGHGRSKKQHGKNGEDLYVPVPLGTVIHELPENNIVGEVLHDMDELMLARGGKGGVGNCHFTTSTHQAPREYTPGEPGEERTYLLELKIVADVGLVGYPNAGKSTLISKLSHAHPKIAAYPFTTLNPVIGTLDFDDFKSLKVADIPGLIEGAHEGVGLGHDFLRHIERTRFLLFVIDMAAVEGRRPEEDYISLRDELRLHREELDHRPYAIIANKMDLPEGRENLQRFIEHTGENPFVVSARHADGTHQVIDHLHRHFFEGNVVPPKQSL